MGMRLVEGKASLARQPARILISDEHDLMREGLRTVLEGEPDFKVVGEAKDGCELLRLCRKVRPDVVLMDLRMRCVDGLEATRVIREELPSTAVVIVTLLEPANYFLEAIKAGAADYVLKDAPHYNLVSTLRRVLSDKIPRLHRQVAYGSTYVSPDNPGIVSCKPGTQSREDKSAALPYIRVESAS
jgi:DNA-binding NarL/FixJ family response regulator